MKLLSKFEVNSTCRSGDIIFFGFYEQSVKCKAKYPKTSISQDLKEPFTSNFHQMLIMGKY